MKLFIALFSLVSTLMAQPSPDILWTRELRSESSAPSFAGVVENAAGESFFYGYYVSGPWIGSNLVMKLAANGDSLWSYSLDDGYESAGALLPLDDGGCVVGGTNFLDTQDVNMTLTRLGANGSVVWRTIVAGVSPASLVSLLIAADGYYLLGNLMSADWMYDKVVAARIDSSGELLWWQELDQPGGTEALQGGTLAPDGIVLAGNMTNNTGFAAGAVVHKVLSDGTVAWNHRVRQREQAMIQMSPLPDERLVLLVVDVTNPHAVYRHQLQFVNSAGQLDSVVQVDTPSDNAPITYTHYSMAVSGEELLLFGSRLDENAPFDPQLSLVKIDLSGDTLWTRRYEYDNTFMSNLASLRMSTTADGAYLLAMTARNLEEPQPNVRVMKTGWDGQVGVLTGRVVDHASQLPLAGVEVALTNGFARTVTNASGQYYFSLAPGSYGLQIRSYAYCAQTIEGINVELQQETLRDVQLVGRRAAVDATSLNIIWAGEEAGTEFHVLHLGGPCSLPFRVLESEEWLRLEPESGEVEEGGAATIQVRTVGWLANPPLEYHTTVRVECAALDSVIEIPLDVFVTVSAADPVELPSRSGIAAIYPNPFNAQTTISFEVAAAGPVLLRVIDVLGREVARLEDGVLMPGVYRKEFSGSDLSSGIYVVELAAAQGAREAMKIVLMK